MRYNVRAATDDWVLFETARAGKLAISGIPLDDDLLDMYHALRLLKAAGCPPDKTRGNPEVDVWRSKCKGEHSKSVFYVLKAKPGRWRLYFLVTSRERREITFLLAVEKKHDKRNPKDFARLCTLRGKLESGTFELVEVVIPNAG